MKSSTILCFKKCNKEVFVGWPNRPDPKPFRYNPPKASVVFLASKQITLFSLNNLIPKEGFQQLTFEPNWRGGKMGLVLVRLTRNTFYPIFLYKQVKN